MSRPGGAQGPRPVRPGQRRWPGRPPDDRLVVRPPELVPLSPEDEAKAVAALAQLLAQRMAALGIGPPAPRAPEEITDDGQPVDGPVDA